MARILIIDDNKKVLQSLVPPLKGEGYQVFTAQSGQAGLEIARRQFLDLVILDLIMPQMDGFETSRRLHELGIQSILIIGPGNDERNIVKCLEMGADDYLSKPVEIPILLAKIRMLMRRNSQQRPKRRPAYDDGQLVIDLDNHRVELRGKPVKLTRTEFRLLSILLRKVGRVVTHEDLIREIWGTEKEANLGSLKLYIYYLRQKIEDQPKEPRYLLAEWGVGYRLLKLRKEQVPQPPEDTSRSSVSTIYQPLAVGT